MASGGPFIADGVMATAKQTPTALGFARPYTLSAKGKLLVDQPSRVEVNDFIAAYRKAGCQLLELFLEWWHRGGDARTVAVLLILPAKISPDIEGSALWEKAQSEAQALNGNGWPALIELRLYYFLRTMAGVEGRAAPGPAMMAEFLARAKFPDLGMTKEKFAGIYEVFPSQKVRFKLTSQVAGILRGFFSQAENARRDSEAKARTLIALRKQAPLFFQNLERLLRAQAAWQQSCRGLRAVRRKLIDQDKFPIPLVNACQIQAIRERPDFTAWQAVTADQPDLSRDGAVLSATPSRQIVDMIAAAFPSLVVTDSNESDLIQRLTTAARIRGLARSPYLARRILELYDQHVAQFPVKERALLTQVDQFGRKAVHTGWREVLNEGPSRSLRDARRFFFNEMAEFAAALRLRKAPTLVPERVAIWPLFEEKKQWWVTKKQPTGIGNAIEIEMKLPAFHDRQEHILSGVVRGNLAFARAAALDEPISVVDGGFQFRPNESVKLDGDPKRKTYLKVQGLSVTARGEELYAVFGIRRMTEPAARVSSRLKDISEFGDGEKVAVLHLSPGGMRLGTLTLFEHRAGSWKLVPTHEEVGRSEIAAHDRSGDQLRRVRNRGWKTHSHLHFDLNSLGLAIDEQASKLQFGEAGKVSLAANRKAIAEIMPVKTALGEVWLRRAARRIGLALAGNGVSRLVVAGRGQIHSRDGQVVPVRRFFSLESIAGRKEAAGYLSDAARKAGVTIHVISGRFSLIDSKNYSAQKTAELGVGIPYRFDSNTGGAGKTSRTREGVPQHLYLPSDPRRVVDFYRNGAESLLMAWADKSFRAKALTMLQKATAAMIELPPET